HASRHARRTTRMLIAACPWSGALLLVADRAACSWDRDLLGAVRRRVSKSLAASAPCRQASYDRRPSSSERAARVGRSVRRLATLSEKFTRSGPGEHGRPPSGPLFGDFRLR